MAALRDAVPPPPAPLPKTRRISAKAFGRDMPVDVVDAPDTTLTDEEIAALPPWQRRAYTNTNLGSGWLDSKGNPVKDDNNYTEGGRYRKAKKGEIPRTLLQSLGISEESLG